MRYPSYKRYRSSDIKWIDQIPKHWAIIPLKRLHHVVNGGTPSSSNDSYWDGKINWMTPEDLGANKAKMISVSRRKISTRGLLNSSASLVPARSILISTRAPIGHIAISEQTLSTNQGCRALVPIGSSTHCDYVYYSLLASRHLLQANGTGTTFLELSPKSLGLHKLPLPPMIEQIRISSFLDFQTNKIDLTIKNLRELIDLIKEKRIAIITNAVTGLSVKKSVQKPDMLSGNRNKDHPSWKLGSIPRNWVAKRLRFISPTITVGIVVNPSKYYRGEGIPCLRSLNVNLNSLSDEKLVYISPESHRILSKSKLNRGDLVVVRSGRPGTTAVVDHRFEGANCIDLIIIRKPYRGNSTFFSYFLNSLPAQAQFAEGSGGAIQQHFNTATALDLWVFEPPEWEQNAIVKYLDYETAKLDATVANIKEAMDRLEEYRLALVTAAVTGTINVQGIELPVMNPDVGER